jgi:hypothetical protein
MARNKGSDGPSGIFSLTSLPAVPADIRTVIDDSSRARRRFPDDSRAEGIAGLREVQSRGASHPGELGDLAPSPEDCGRLADEIEAGTRLVVRLQSLLDYAKAHRAVREDQASRLIDEAYEQVEARVSRGRLAPEAYPNVKMFVEARGAAVSDGIAQARALRQQAGAGGTGSDPVGGSGTTQ